jgi:beta-lactamase regulating signal transducer with metallopeptidase domain
MDNTKETLSVTRKYTIQYIINGVLWLLNSISNLIPFNPVRIIGAVLLFVSTICSFYTLLAPQESDDEMSIQHIWAAKSMSLEILLCSVIIVGIISNFVSFSFHKAYGFFVATSQILPGLLFLKYEKEGC